MDDYEKVGITIRESRGVVAFTGAGISVDSGIPAFRGGQGLWEKYDPMEYAHIQAFYRDPGKVWTMLREMASVIFSAEPSPAHKALASLEDAALLTAVITQNVDGLHQVAGNGKVIEYHGNHRRLVCIHCKGRREFVPDALKIVPYPTCEKCGEPLKPDVVFFGEQIPILEQVEANEQAKRCKVMIIIGTSGVVYPAAEIPYIAHSNGAKIVEINLEPTPFTSSISHYFFAGSASTVLPRILQHVSM
jgi:NAD-dependent deacetylase